MTESTNAPVVPFIPTFAPVKLNGRQNDLLPFDVHFDRAIFALNQLRYDYKEEGNKKRYFVHVEALECDNPRLKPGQTTTLHFPLDRPDVGKQFNRAEKDAEKFGKFICAMLGLTEASPEQLAQACAAIESQGRITDRSVQFGMARKAGKTEEKPVKGKDGKLERDAAGQIVTEMVTYSNDYFFPARVEGQ